MLLNQYLKSEVLQMCSPSPLDLDLKDEIQQDQRSQKFIIVIWDTMVLCLSEEMN